MSESMFRFKQFFCSHGSSSIKIGVDAVLLGAWADVKGSTILDVGTGCGVIALQCAQRNPDARIIGIDIDPASIEEASGNFESSPWSARLEAILCDFSGLADHGSRTDASFRYDRIISNPPFFSSGVSSPHSSRLKARHQGELSPSSLLAQGARLISDSGKIAMIVPSDQEEELVAKARQSGLEPARCCRVRGHAGAPVKRAMLEFRRASASDAYESASDAYEIEYLTLEDAPGQPTEAYRTLCKDFYLKF